MNLTRALPLVLVLALRAPAAPAPTPTNALKAEATSRGDALGKQGSNLTRGLTLPAQAQAATERFELFVPQLAPVR